MEIVFIIILSCLLLVATIVAVILYKQNSILNNNLEKLVKEKTADLNKKLEDVVNDRLINLHLRTGFYEYTTHLLKKGNDPNDYDVYKSVIYVTELEKYQNGYSKVRLDKIDIISGVNMDNYEYVKKTQSKKFKEIIESKDVTWLEKDKDLTEVRKDKLERILKEE